MATAKIETVTKTVEKEVEERVVQLTLTEREAKVLRALVGFVSGDRSESYRKDTDAIRSALINAGFGMITVSEYFGGGLSAKVSR